MNTLCQERRDELAVKHLLTSVVELAIRYNEPQSPLQKVKTKPFPKIIFGMCDDRFNSYQKSYLAYKDEFFKVSEKLQKSLAGLHFDTNKTQITFHPKTNDQLLKDALVEFIKNNNRSETTLSSDSIQTVLFSLSISISEFVDNKDKIIDVVNSSDRATIHTQVLQDLLRAIQYF